MGTRAGVLVQLLAVKPAGQGMGHCTNSISVILPDNTIIRIVRIVAPYRAAIQAAGDESQEITM